MGGPAVWANIWSAVLAELGGLNEPGNACVACRAGGAAVALA